MATNMIKDSDVVEVDEEDAPRAIPSAAACIQRPSVVDMERCGVGGLGGGDVERSEREYILLRGRCGVGGARDGRVSKRYMRMKPQIKEIPIQACGSRFA